MHLSSPTFEFFVPSVYDGTQLDCRIYLPREFQRLESASSWQKRGAIVAHPYASLGGCYDDPVVGFVGGELLKSGYVVLTFNFRLISTILNNTSLGHGLHKILGGLVNQRAVPAGQQNPNWRITFLSMDSFCISCMV